ncbi:MAG: carbohydrate kinase family protein [Chloroflexota bacterium]
MDRSDARVIVAGHLCLDLFPGIPGGHGRVQFNPGALLEIGDMSIVTGGSVSNTGTALHRLGIPVRLIGKIADDPFGAMMHDIIAGVDARLAADLVVTPGAGTSYSIIFSPPHEDRMVLHFAGANDTFTAEDVEVDRLRGADIFHFGYPPLMRSMYANAGEQLLQIMTLAKDAGLVTALDMAYPDPASPAGQVDWNEILRRVLPVVDVFMPSLPEVLLMLEPDAAHDALVGGVEALLQTPADRIVHLGMRLLEMGSAIAAIKVGERGLCLCTAPHARLNAVAERLSLDPHRWSDRQLWSSVYQTEAVGTTGAGDATNAGLVLGLLRGMSPHDALSAACAVGASSVEEEDATSGIRTWDETHARMLGGWRRHDRPPGPGWTACDVHGIWMPAHV